MKSAKQNIVLVGMPSSGKTTVGRILAEKCGKELADTDEYIVKKIGMSISDFFAKFGEPEFRRIEKETIAELGRDRRQGHCDRQAELCSIRKT